MREETEQIKKEKKSSTDNIDSIIDSHNHDSSFKDNHKNGNMEETEQLIDQIIEKKVLSNKHHGSMTPKVNIYKKKITQDSKKDNVSKDTTSISQRKKNNYEHHNKENLIEIEKPKKHNQEQKRFSKSQKDSNKIKFSIHLPKIRIKTKKRKRKKKKSSFQPKTIQKKKEQAPLKAREQAKKINKPEPLGKISGKHKIKENKDRKQEKQHIQPAQKKKKTKFKTKNKSFNFLKKKTEKTKKKFPKQQSIEQKKATTQKKEGAFTQEKENLSKQSTPSTDTAFLDEDLIQLLKITDDLLGKLPDDVIEEFSQSEDFTLYEKVMKKYKIVK